MQLPAQVLIGLRTLSQMDTEDNHCESCCLNEERDLWNGEIVVPIRLSSKDQ